MSLSLLAYALPLSNVVKTILAIRPGSYHSYDDLPESDYSKAVKDLVQRFLQAEKDWPGTPYEERIRESTIEDRLRVISMRNKATPIHSAGTSLDLTSSRGKLFIAIDPDIDSAALKALPWVVAREVSHLLDQDWALLQSAKAVESLAATIFATLCGLDLLPSLASGIVGDLNAHITMVRLFETRADDFANRHCTAEERRNAVALLKENEKARSAQGLFKRLIFTIMHPSEDYRIARIQSTLYEQVFSGIIERAAM